MHDRIWYDGYYSCSVALRFNLWIYDLSDIVDIYFLIEFHR